MFAALDRYWDSDQSLIDEFQDTSVEKLLRLRELDKMCLAAMDEHSEEDYWEWRSAQEWSNGFKPSHCKPIAEVRRITEKHLRCVEHTLRYRGCA